jgi:hypothetical protein
MTVALSIEQPPYPDAPLQVDVAVMPERNVPVGPRHFSSFTAPTVEAVMETIRERFPKQTLSVGLHKPFARVEEVPLPPKMPAREIHRAIRTQIQTLGYGKNDDVRTIRLERDGKIHYYIAAIAEDTRKAILSAGKVKNIESIAYGWARATKGVAVLIDATRAKQENGWVALTVIAEPRADTATLPWNSDAVRTMENGIVDAMRAGFFNALPTVVHVIDPDGVLPNQTIAGATLAPLPTPLPTKLAHYVSLLAIGGAH